MIDPPFEIVTERDEIRTVASRWRAQYRHGDGTWVPTMFGDSEKTYTDLIALDLETATPDDIAAVIGNTSWVDMICDACHEEVRAVALFDVYGEYSFRLCKACLTQAGEALGDREC